MNKEVYPADIIPQEPDGGNTQGQMHWRSLAAAIATISAMGAAIGLGIPLLSVLLESRGHSASLIGANTAVAGLASIVAAPLAAPIAARLGVAKAIVLMLLIGSVAFLGFHFFSATLGMVCSANRPAFCADSAFRSLGILDQRLRSA